MTKAQPFASGRHRVDIENVVMTQRVSGDTSLISEFRVVESTTMSFNTRCFEVWTWSDDPVRNLRYSYAVTRLKSLVVAAAESIDCADHTKVARLLTDGDLLGLVLDVEVALRVTKAGKTYNLATWIAVPGQDLELLRVASAERKMLAASTSEDAEHWAAVMRGSM